MIELLFLAALVIGWLAGLSTALLVGYLVERQRFTGESEEFMVKMAQAIIQEEQKRHGGDSPKT